MANGETALVAALTQAPELLDGLGDLFEVGVLGVDADLVITRCNAWVEAASGRSASELVGRPLLEAFPEIQGTAREAAFRQALAGNVAVLAHRFHRFLLPFEAPLARDGFARMQQSARVIPVPGADGGTAGAVALIRDVSERVAREEELRDAMQRAQEASKAKSDFLAVTSHELRTPLSAVIGYADLLAREFAGPLGERQSDYVERIKTCAWHLLSIIEEILAFSRLDAGKEVVHEEEVDATALAREIVLMLEPQALGKGLAMEASLPDGPVRMRTDATKLRQVLINLLGNAVKFTDDGSVALAMTHDPDAARVVFAVRDTGPGIAVEDLDRVFEAFVQVDSSRTRTRGGTGLGLPVSRNIARLLGGDLTLESAPGEGSTFTLSLPVRYVPVEPPAEPAGAAGGRGA